MKKREKSKSTKVNTLNTPYLIIVESPSKCLKIEKYLGFEYKCIASKGHVRELSKVHKDYTPEYKIIEEKAEHVKWMMTTISQFEKKNIFLATDDDREGEGIAWHLCDIFHLDPITTHRIIFHEVTATALKLAVSNPIFLRMNIVKAQQARQILDRMIGFQISPVLSRLLIRDDSAFLSAGRCQTPTLRLVYDRHLDSLHKTEKIQYKVQGIFLSTLTAQLNTHFETEDELNNFLQNSQEFSHILKNMEKFVKEKPSPMPFSTSKLLQAASSLLHMSPKYVMDCCQKLYQDGKITYMRTESTKLSKGFLEQCTEFIHTTYGGDYVGDLKGVTNEDSNNPHEAIRVTNLKEVSVDSSDAKMNALYHLIWKRSIESCMKPCQVEENSFQISAPETISTKTNEYSGMIEVPLYLGWKRVTTLPAEMQKIRDKTTADLQYMKYFLGKKISYLKLEGLLFMKDTEKYFDEASLIQKLEKLGIGRPSTYSMLVETVQERKYLVKQDVKGEDIKGNEYILTKDEGVCAREIIKTFGASKNKLQIQPLGIQVVDILLKYFEPLFNYEYTSMMEKALDSCHDNEKQICSQCESLITKCLKPLRAITKQPYRIDDHHELVFGKSGIMIVHKNDENVKSFKCLKRNLQIDFEKLVKGNYQLTDLVIENESLGNYENVPIFLKSGPHGFYATWGEEKHSLLKILKKKKIDEITGADVVSLIVEKKTVPERKKINILRELDESSSVRTGKYGNYIFYKPTDADKPQFLNLKKCPHNVLVENTATILQWIQQETLIK